MRGIERRLARLERKVAPTERSGTLADLLRWVCQGVPVPEGVTFDTLSWREVFAKSRGEKP
jgi:hypothetical protein